MNVYLTLVLSLHLMKKVVLGTIKQAGAEASKLAKKGKKKGLDKAHDKGPEKGPEKGDKDHDKGKAAAAAATTGADKENDAAAAAAVAAAVAVEAEKDRAKAMEEGQPASPAAAAFSSRLLALLDDAPVHAPPATAATAAAGGSSGAGVGVAAGPETEGLRSAEQLIDGFRAAFNVLVRKVTILFEPFYFHPSLFIFPRAFLRLTRALLYPSL